LRPPPNPNGPDKSGLRRAPSLMFCSSNGFTRHWFPHSFIKFWSLRTLPQKNSAQRGASSAPSGGCNLGRSARATRTPPCETCKPRAADTVNRRIRSLLDEARWDVGCGGMQRIWRDEKAPSTQGAKTRGSSGPTLGPVCQVIHQVLFGLILSVKIAPRRFHFVKSTKSNTFHHTATTEQPFTNSLLPKT
jgi:hypothetical protein